ncbi:MarR family transcriptional regulator [Lactobacillus alvi]|uniref:MarR family transcriptional regulator n=1 Tax=Limosilactobacillus alvi TaxID=990412 RepID=A0ABS2EPI9_9LACO|nr:MarR family transcriptional regulator [Limosilactobacillus alvi]MBM6754325.1 MarR family transcriptional regulator [Limosilactobacillus alvi]
MDPKIQEITILIATLRNQRKTDLSEAQTWMLAHAIDNEQAALIPQIAIVGYHILDQLSIAKELNGTELAARIRVSRSGTTRAAKHLVNLHLVTSQRHPNNQKSIYYQLTTTGLQLAKLHQEMHQNLYRDLQVKIAKEYQPKELAIIARFLKEIVDHQ